MTRGYDDAGRLTSVQDWLSNTTSFAYDVNSNLTTETLPKGNGVVDTFTFDAADRLTAVSDTKGRSTLFSATYTRDNANQLTSDSSAPSSTSAYKYTVLNQVCYAGSSSTGACSSPPSGSTAYAYDAADNVIQLGITQQAFNNADEICWAASTSGSCASPPSGATTYVYDARGNRTTVTPPSGGATSLSYDQANRLTAYGSSATYAYNGDGLRMSKTVSGTTSQFLWDLASTVPMLLKDGSTAYVYGPGGLPLEQINGSTALWLHHDQLGSTRLVTDTTAASQATYTFDAYGNLTASTGSITNPLRFAGQYSDAESSLYYVRARYYDPSGGQFISRDPAVASTREPYAYVGDNSLNRVDPSGMDWCNQPDATQALRQFACGAASWGLSIGPDVAHATFNPAPTDWCNTSDWHVLWHGECDQALVLIKHSKEFADAADKLASFCTVVGQAECSTEAGAFALTCHAVAMDAGIEKSEAFRKAVGEALLDEAISRMGKAGDLVSRAYKGFQLLHPE